MELPTNAEFSKQLLEAEPFDDWGSDDSVGAGVGVASGSAEGSGFSVGEAVAVASGVAEASGDSCGDWHPASRQIKKAANTADNL